MTESTLRAIIPADGVPYLTKSQELPMYASQDPLKGGPQQTRCVKFNILDLSLQNDKKMYEKIWEATGLGAVVVADEAFLEVKEKKSWIVRIKWFIPHTMDPSELKARKASLIDELL